MLNLLKASTPLMYSTIPNEGSQAYTASQRQNAITTETVMRKQGLKFISCKMLVVKLYVFLGWLSIINANLTQILKKPT